MPAQVVDLSVTGVRLRLEQPLDLRRGSVLHVRCGGHDGDLRVRHVAGGSDGQEIGAEFEQLSPGLRELLHQRVGPGADASDWRWSWDDLPAPGAAAV